MAGQRPAEGCVRQGSLRGVRLRQQRLGRDLSVGAAHDRRAAGGAWRAQRLCARRGRCPQRSRRPVRELVRQGGARGDEGIRRRFDSFTRSADDEPLYTIEPVAPTAVNAIVAQGGVSPMKVLLNCELQNKSGANPSDRSTRHIEVQLPPGVSYRVGDHLSVVPRNDPALVDSVARRFGFLPADQIRLQVAEGRRAQLPVGDAVSVGRLLDRVRRVAADRDPQADPDHVGTHALSDDQAETAGLCRRRCRLDRALSHRRSGKTQIGVRPAGGTSGLRTAVPRLSRNAVAAGAALLFDLVVTVGRCRALQRHRRRGRGAREFGTRRLQGRLLELSRRPPRRRHHPRHGARDQGRLPPAGRCRRCRSS